MPGLNLSFVLGLGLFKTTFDVIRATKGVDADGVTDQLEAPVAGVEGVVQPLKDMSLQRMPDGAMQSNTIEIHTTYRLTAGVEGQGADRVIWRGAEYTVTDVADWSQYGSGYVKALAQLSDLRPYE